MDDILVYSCTLSNHQQIIHQVLSTLQEQRLFLKPEKCKFKQKEVEYLGLVISKDHVTMDPTKKAITSAPVLTFPSQSGCFHLKCDASNFVARAVLSQAQADGIHQPIAFMSKGISDVECNYQIHNKEMLAIMCALDEWCHFLEGMEKFEILTDHQNLNHQQACWS